MAVKFAHLDFSSDICTTRIDARERDILLQNRRSGSTGDHANLCASDMHAIAMRTRFIATKFEPNQLALGMFLASNKGFSPDKVLVL